MGKSYHFRVIGDPKPGGSKRGFPYKDRKTGQTRVAITEDAKRNKEWRSDVKDAAIREGLHNMTMLRPPLQLEVVFVLRRPKGHFGTGKNASVLKPSAVHYHTTKPDATKLLRSTEDALTGLLWEDDSQISRPIVTKRYAYIGEAPGAFISVSELEDVGRGPW